MAAGDGGATGLDELALLRQIVDASADCIKVLDLGAHLLDMNEGGRRVMEIDDFGVCERALWPSFWPEETRPDLLAAVAAAQGGDTGRFEGFCPTFRGTPRWWEVTVSPVRGADGEVGRLLAVSRDITRHRQAEETARRQAELLELTNDAVLVWTLGGGVTYWNRAAEELYGFTRQEALGQVTHRLLGTRRGDGLDAPTFEARLREEGAWRGRLSHRAKDGREVVVDSRHVLMPGEHPGEFAVLESSRDVTEQVRAETRLRESEAHFRRLADANPIGVVIGDEAGGLPYVNDAFLRLIQASREDFAAGRVNWQAITPPEWLPADERAIRQARERGHSDPYEKEYLLPGGTRLSILVAVTRAGIPHDGLVAYVLDLSDRKAAERALSDRNARLEALNRQILDSAGEGIFGLDLRGHTTFANPAALALTGFALEEMLGRPQHALLHHTRADGTPYPEGECPVQAARRDGEVRRVDGEVFWRRDGTSFPVEYVATPLRGTSGETEGVVVTFRDVTARQEAEAALRRSNEDLARSNRELEQFAFVAAHDLQEPLRTVVSYAGLLERKHADELSDGARRYLGFITGGATRMKTLVDDLLAYASLNVVSPARRPVALAGPLSTALEALGAAVQGTGARVEADELPTVPGDARQLAQVFQNLIGNALKFRRPGVPPVIRVQAVREGREWQVRVGDNGIGMEAAYLERVFGMFQRLHTRDRYEGTGLGLAICQKIVEGHGGRIWASSTPGEGTTFHLTLPAAGEA
ncbi:PAS domain-containing sensor histidine kinase (plasmid) [Deinococcus aetherius]|uniref:histidine kinase n=2 Tax=Deinococcus aetherius TaxID=200252 RepID=A0ABM8AKU2_9DEIO|nr:PAS domain-containing sensor histidine kinase [Deinococcus aetherius]